MADELKFEPTASDPKPVIDVSRERIRKCQFTSFGIECYPHVELNMRRATLEKCAQLKLIVEKRMKIA